MVSRLQILFLALALAVFTAQAKLELPSTHKKTMEAVNELNLGSKNLLKADPNPNPVCSTKLNVGESFNYTVTDNANITSGYMNVNNKTADALFYIFYKCRNLTATQKFTDVPLLIWLQGGPGGSSLLGAFAEKIGPYSVIWNETANRSEEQPNEKSWNDNYNLLFIEHPIGVGFGNLENVGELDQNEEQVGKHFVQGLLSFYNLSQFTGLQKTPLYIFGESYAGHYIPSVANAILKYNNKTGGTAPYIRIPLKGIGIGDGWTDPPNQLSEFGLFAYALGLVDEDQRAQIEGAQVDAIYNIAKGREHLAKGEVELAHPYMKQALQDFDDLNDIITKQGGGLNVYNYRQFGGYEALFKNMTEYMNSVGHNRYCQRGSILGNQTWVPNSDPVYANLSHTDFMNTVTPALIEVLKELPVLLFNGQDDIICNSPSTQTWISKLEWSGQQQFYEAPQQIWVLNNGTHAGWAKAYDKLTFVLVNNAGHMVPMDQIDPSIEMIGRFINGEKKWDNNSATFPETFDEKKVLIESEF